MGAPPRDPLAEHPLTDEPAARKSKNARTLDLFPDVSETLLSGHEGLRESSAAPSAPAEEPRESPRARTASQGASGAASNAASKASVVDVAEPVEEAGIPLDESHAPDEEAGVAFARRMAAGMADLLILALVGAVELTAGAFVLELRFPPAALVFVFAFLFLAALVLLVLAPFVWGTTPGMALADLRIRAADGGSPTLSASLLRFVGFVLTGALAGVPLLVAAFDKRGRTLADLLSNTTMAPAERPVPSEPV